MKKNRILALLLVLCLTVGLLAGCGGSSAPASTAPAASDAAEEPAAAGDDSTLVIAIQDEIEGCDIQQIGWNNMVHELLYQPLVTFSEDLSSLNCDLCESYTATDEYLEFVLPEDAKFCNGDPLDAEALMASEERFMAISEYAGDLDAVTGFEIVDSRTIRYMISGAAPYMWCSLASTFGGVVDVDVVNEIGDEAFNRNPVGNGPYYVEDWVQGSHMVLKRNPYYRTNNPDVQNKEAPAFETIIVRFIPDEFTRVSELESGDVDIIYNVPTTSMEDLRANPDIGVNEYLLPGFDYMNMQSDNGILADITVRQALSLAVNREELCDALDGLVTPTYGFITEAMTGYSAAEEAKLAEMLAYDPEQAVALLAQAGWTDTDGDGFADKDGQKLTVEMLVPSDRDSLKACGPVLQMQFAAVGVDAQIREYEADYVKQLMKENSFDLGGREVEWADADILYYVFTDESGYSWNTDEIKAALVAARTENDPDARIAAYEVASDLIAAQYKGISLFVPLRCVATKANVEGLIVTNDGRTWFNDTSKG